MKNQDFDKLLKKFKYRQKRLETEHNIEMKKIYVKHSKSMFIFRIVNSFMILAALLYLCMSYNSIYMFLFNIFCILIIIVGFVKCLINDYKEHIKLQEELMLLFLGFKGEYNV